MAPAKPALEHARRRTATSRHSLDGAAAILDAQDFAGEPIATIRLPVRVPFGFHGGSAPDVNAASVLA